MAVTFKYSRPPFHVRSWYRTKKFFRWYKNLYVGSPWYKKTFVIIVSMIVFFFGYLGAVDMNLFWLFGKSPGIAKIMEEKPNTGSRIMSADGVEIGSFYDVKRLPIEYHDVKEIFWQALKDTEDERFDKHFGIDPVGLLGAFKDALTGHSRGGSTLTQQLAKNYFRTRSDYGTGLIGKIPGFRLLIEKTKEWIIATKIELWLTVKFKGDRKAAKQKILEMYANTVDYGNNLFGIKRASQSYFGHDPSELDVDEAAVLVGVLKGTSLYNPRSKPENSLKRRNVVLNNLLTHNHITKDEYEEYSSKSLGVKKAKEEKEKAGKALYFKDAVEKEFNRWCNDNGEDFDLYTDGLTIYTTIDSRMQEYAESSMESQMKRIQSEFTSDWGGEIPWAQQDRMLVARIVEKLPVYEYYKNKYGEKSDSLDYFIYRKKHPVKLFTWDNNSHTTTRDLSVADSVRYMLKYMRCSMVAMEPGTGDVKAYIGGLDHNYWKYDAAQAAHQAGSTFKLFVYTEAMNQGMTPCDRRKDEPFTINIWDGKQNKTWSPRNAGGTFSGDSLYLKTAFARSINSVAAKLGDQVGINNVLETAHKMGIQSEIKAAPSVALGACDVTLMEMVNSYCTVANYGRHVKPRLITKIVTHDDDEYENNINEDSGQAIPERTAFLMQKMLMAGRTETGGTSQRLNEYVGGMSHTDFGGKTGTTNNNSDGWYMCVTPKLVVGAWVGGEYRSIHFRSGRLGQGGHTALPICGSFLKKVLTNNSLGYRGHFDQRGISDIEASMYSCSGSAPSAPVQRDTTMYAPIDSLPPQEENTLEGPEAQNEQDGNPQGGQQGTANSAREFIKNNQANSTAEKSAQPTQPTTTNP